MGIIGMCQGGYDRRDLWRGNNCIISFFPQVNVQPATIDGLWWRWWSFIGLKGALEPIYCHFIPYLSSERYKRNE